MRGSAAFRTGVAPGGALAGPWVKNELYRKARAAPSLDLRFADNKLLTDAITGANLVTFTRASSGTFVGSDGVLRSATTNEARFDHNPTTGKSLGLLVEEARTNLVLRSEEFNNGSWTKIAVTVTADAIVSPSSALNADKLVETTANSTHYAVQSVSVTTTSRTASIYLKAGERTQVRVEHSGNTGGAARRLIINLSTGAITSASTIGTGGLNSFSESIVSVGNGWYRVISTIDPTVTLGNTQALVVLTADNTGQATYTGDGTSGIYLWGAQLEAGAFATSYIPTTTATVTRAADVASIGGSAFSSWYRQDEGTLFFDGRFNTVVVQTAIVSINDAALPGNNRHSLRIGNSIIITTGSLIASFFQTPVLQAVAKYAYGYAANNFAQVLNSTSTSVDTAGAVPVGVNTIEIGKVEGTQIYSNGTISRLTYWGQRLPNNVLQAITQP